MNRSVKLFHIPEVTGSIPGPEAVYPDLLIVAFLSPPRQMLGQRIKVGHTPALFHILPRNESLSFSTQRYIASAFKNLVKYELRNNFVLFQMLIHSVWFYTGRARIVWHLVADATNIITTDVTTTINTIATDVIIP
jgi:hypothetical protein